jgi:hypothetical protein
MSFLVDKIAQKLFEAPPNRPHSFATVTSEEQTATGFTGARLEG